MSLDKLKDVVEKFDGNKAAVARHLGYSEKYIRSLCKKIREKHPDWPHYTYIHELKDKKMGNCFPTNEERLRYLDYPEMNLTKKFGRVKDTYNYFEDEHKVHYD